MESVTAQTNDRTEKRFVHETGAAGEIAALAEPVVEDLDLRLVRVIVSGRDGGTVQIMVEDSNGTCSIENCTSISRLLSPLLDASDPIPGSYRLEVSSPGIDRPLVRAHDFEAWAGYEAKIELNETIDGRKRFRGRIEGFEDGEVRLEVELEGFDEPQMIGFPAEMISSAKLVMNDALIKAAIAKRPARNDDTQSRTGKQRTN